MDHNHLLRKLKKLPEKIKYNVAGFYQRIKADGQPVWITVVMINGKKYSHTINLRTGLPVSVIKSVTIISPNAEISDALATPVTVMGVTNGLNLINQIHQVECIIIDDDNKIHTSKNINCI